MPPRYAYWTILIDDKPTAFRAREREELLPTFAQLRRRNANVTMPWFARGRLWASREAERDDFQMRRHAAAAPHERRADRPEGAERRGSDWRPGGTHKDPRDRFKKKNRPERAWSENDPATQRDRDKPGFASSIPREPRRRLPDPRTSGGGWSNKPAGGAPPGDRGWQTKPTGPRAQRKPWSNKPAGGAPRRDRPWRDKPAGGPPRGHRPWSDKQAGGPPRGDRSWSNTPPSGRRPSDREPEPRRRSSEPRASTGGWRNTPSGGDRKPFRSRTGPRRNGPRKKRDDEPPDRG